MKPIKVHRKKDDRHLKVAVMSLAEPGKNILNLTKKDKVKIRLFLFFSFLFTIHQLLRFFYFYSLELSDLNISANFDQVNGGLKFKKKFFIIITITITIITIIMIIIIIKTWREWRVQWWRRRQEGIRPWLSQTSQLSTPWWWWWWWWWWRWGGWWWYWW